MWMPCLSPPKSLIVGIAHENSQSRRMRTYLEASLSMAELSWEPCSIRALLVEVKISSSFWRVEMIQQLPFDAFVLKLSSIANARLDKIHESRANTMFWKQFKVCPSHHLVMHRTKKVLAKRVRMFCASKCTRSSSDVAIPFLSRFQRILEIPTKDLWFTSGTVSRSLMSWNAVNEATTSWPLCRSRLAEFLMHSMFQCQPQVSLISNPLAITRQSIHTVLSTALLLRHAPFLWVLLLPWGGMTHQMSLPASPTVPRRTTNCQFPWRNKSLWVRCPHVHSVRPWTALFSKKVSLWPMMKVLCLSPAYATWQVQARLEIGADRLSDETSLHPGMFRPLYLWKCRFV